MWPSSRHYENSGVKSDSKAEDSGAIDSGYICDNLLVSNDISEDIDELPEIDSGRVEEIPEEKVRLEERVESMRIDSGVDLGLNESLSQLSLQGVSQVDGQRLEFVKPEPILERIVVKVQDDLQQDIEPWQLYYIQDDDGDTQLHIAIIQGFLEAAAFTLIRIVPHPCLLDIINDDGQAPLHLAVLTQQPRIVRRLIIGGADPTLRDHRGNTALHLACAANDLAAARALTDSLAPIERSYLGSHNRIPALPQNLEQVNYQGETCLHIAAAMDNVDLVRLLLRLGSDLEAREGLSGKTILHIAIERGCKSVITFLLTECRPYLDAVTYAGLTAYQLAVCLDAKLAMQLVNLGASAEPLPEADSEYSDASDMSDAELDDVYVSGIRAQQRIEVMV